MLHLQCPRIESTARVSAVKVVPYSVCVLFAESRRQPIHLSIQEMTSRLRASRGSAKGTIVSGARKGVLQLAACRHKQ